MRTLAEQIAEHGPVDLLVHNAGVWVRGDTPRVTPDGFDTTFAVNVLAPHLLTALLADQLSGRLLSLGSGLARSGRVRLDALGVERDSRVAYADSKACDVALAMAWGRRLPQIASAAVDPGWVKTKLASPGAHPATPGSRPTLSSTARPRPTWAEPRTGGTGARCRSPSTFAIPRCRTLWPPPVIG